MKYVYKVVGNFNDSNFTKILDKISKNFVYIYMDRTLFIALKTAKESEEAEALMNKTFRPVRDFYIEEVNEKSINNLRSLIKDWCLDNLVRLDTERYEIENQTKLKRVWESMDRMEEELNQKLQEKNNS